MIAGYGNGRKSCHCEEWHAYEIRGSYSYKKNWERVNIVKKTYIAYAEYFILAEPSIVNYDFLVYLNPNYLMYPKDNYLL